MRNRQPIFALEYIGETVTLYQSVADHLEPNEAAWAHDVLSLYFRTVQAHPDLERWRQCFEQAAERRTVNALLTEQTPYRSADRPPLEIGFESLNQLVRRRRSIRWFLPTPIPHSAVEAAVSLAREAPSACNRQPYYFKFVSDPASAQRLASIAMGTAGYANQIPALVIVVGDWSCLAEERDRHIPYIDGSLAAMQFMLACETLGLGTCPINWPDVERLERRMDRELGLPLYQRPVMLIAVGYPDPEGGVARSTKKPVGDLLR